MAKDKNMSSKERIRLLTEENKKLKKEIDALKTELAEAKGKKSIRGEQDSVKSDFEAHALNAKLFSKDGYTSYLFGLIANSSIFRLYKKMIGFVKKYTFITTTINILTYLFVVIQSSAVFVIAASVFTVSLPLTFIIGYAAIVVAHFGGRKRYKKISALLKDKELFLFFATRGDSLSCDSFFANNLRDITNRSNGVAIVISPYFFSLKGICEKEKRKFFFSARREEENIIIIRRHYFFALKRKFSKITDKKITAVY